MSCALGVERLRENRFKDMEARGIRERTLGVGEAPVSLGNGGA